MTTTSMLGDRGKADEPVEVPAGYLEVAGLEFVPFRELADRREWLLDTIGSAGAGANHPGVRTAALVLPAVLTELDTRGRLYMASADRRYWCSCGFGCTGLADFDRHLDQYPPEHPGSDAHVEVTEDSAAGQAVQAEQNG
jgi:hypothetical protein